MTPDEHKNHGEILTLMHKHFEDDKVSFGRLEEILKQNGEHMSYIRKDINETRTMLLEQNKKFDEHRHEVITQLAELQKDSFPVIKEFKERLIVENDREKKLNKLKGWSAAISSIGVIGYAIVWVLSKIQGK
jgi:CII-binding regulator of phage lambda lysogenization HflD